MPSPTPQPLRRRRHVTPAPAPRWRTQTINLVLAFVAIVLVVDAFAGNRGLLETMRVRRQYAGLAANLARTRRENDRLREEIIRLRDDPATIESVAREELGLIRQDELVFIVHDADKPGR
jgi:cell division protein FtsB